MADWAGAIQLDGSADYVLRIEVDLVSQDTAGNDSTVDWALVAVDTNGWGAFGFYSTDWAINVGSHSSSTKSSFDFRPSQAGKRVVIATGRKTIAHNADGTKTFEARGFWDSQHGSIGQGMARVDITLPTIPRATQPSVSGSVDAGAALTISTPRASSSFTHTLSYSFGGASGTIATGVATSHNWTVPISLLNQIPDATSGVGTITCRTYSGSTYIGIKTVKFTVKAGSAIVPSFTTVTHSEAEPIVASSVGAYVQTLSRLNLALTGAAGTYGSTIESHKITVDGQTVNAQSGVTAAINASGTVNIVGTVTDSRGRTASKTIPITVLAYQPPQLSGVSVRRSTAGGIAQDDGTHVRVDLVTSASSLINGTEKNGLSFTVESRMPNAGWVVEGTWPLAQLSYSGNVVAGDGTLSVASSYEIRVTATDLFGSAVAIRPLATAQVPFTVATVGTGHGKVWERGSVDAAGEVYHRNGSLVEPVGIVVDFAGDTAPTGWLLCEGQAVSRATYAKLFAVVGEKYGPGNGSTTFNVPDKRKRVTVGRDATDVDFDTLGKTGGEKAHVLTNAEMPKTPIVGNTSGARTRMTSGQYTLPTTGAYNLIVQGNGDTLVLEGGEGAHNNLQPYIVLHSIIKAL